MNLKHVYAQHCMDTHFARIVVVCGLTTQLHLHVQCGHNVSLATSGGGLAKQITTS